MTLAFCAVVVGDGASIAGGRTQGGNGTPTGRTRQHLLPQTPPEGAA